MGDSIATSWLPAIIGALEPAGYRVQALTKQGCPIALTKVYPSQSSTTPYDACTSHRAWAADTVRSINPEMVTLMTPPGAKNLQECYTPLSNPSDCTGVVSAEWQVLKASESAAIATKGGAFIDTKAWFCIQDACPSFAGNRAIYADSGHLTGAFSSGLAPVVAEAFKKAGVIVP